MKMATCTLDDVNDYCCSFCVKEVIGADFYCGTCLKFLCGQCIHFHMLLNRNHLYFGRNALQQWPVSKKVLEFLSKCDEHSNENIEMFCGHHNQLCCKTCVFLNHSQCRKVTIISMLFDTRPIYPRGLLVDLGILIEDIKSLNRAQKARVQLLQEAFKEHEIQKLQQMRHNINNTINAFSRIPLTTYSRSENTIKEQTNTSIIYFLDDFENNTLKELKAMKDEVIDIKNSITESVQKCTGLQNDLTLLYDTMLKSGDNKELFQIVKIKSEHKIRHALAVLGKSDKVLTVKNKTEHPVRIPSDSYDCCISAICVLSDGQVLVVDRCNDSVKLLNQQLQVVSQWDSIDRPNDICQITPTEVAVTANGRATHKIHFLTVIESRVVPGRYIELEHSCLGIAHHQGNLFICSDSAVHSYSLSGKLVRRLYEDQSRVSTVLKCAVSPTGDKLYIINDRKNRLLTLARDGTILAEFGLLYLTPMCVHVTHAGQVLVCGTHGTHEISQVDSEGRRILAHLDIVYGVRDPVSVCYSRTTSSVIVGQKGNNIVVFRVE